MFGTVRCVDGRSGEGLVAHSLVLDKHQSVRTYGSRMHLGLLLLSVCVASSVCLPRGGCKKTLIMTGP